MSPREQARFRILKIVSAQPDITQRELAERLGVSLGKTNFLIKSLVEKGLIKVGNFQRAENKFNKYAYLLTPAGIRERIRLMRTYLARKEAEYEAIRDEIQVLRREMATADERH
jgi:EPS-associated MarR family transcriptional regulator